MVGRIPINADISLSVDDLDLQAVRAQGAGGQNVNKVASAIHLRFDFENCSALPAFVKAKLARLDDRRVTNNGIVIKAQEFRTQARNRQAAIERLQELIRSVLVVEKPRIPTRPSKRVRKKRVDSKRKQGALKRSRSTIDSD